MQDQELDQELEYVELFETVRPPRQGGFDAWASHFGRGPKAVTDRPLAVLPYLRRDRALGPLVVLKDAYGNEVLVPWHQVKVFSLPKAETPVSLNEQPKPEAPKPAPPPEGKPRIRELPHDLKV